MIMVLLRVPQVPDKNGQELLFAPSQKRVIVVRLASLFKENVLIQATGVTDVQEV